MMKVSYSFYARNSKLYVRINLGVQNKKKAISLKTDVGNNRVVNNKVTGKSLASIEANSLINKLEKAFVNCDNAEQAINVVQLALKGEDMTTNPETVSMAFEEMINEMKGGNYRCSGKKITQATISTYEYALVHYKAFVGLRDIRLSDIDLFKIRDRKKRRNVVQRTQKHFQGFIDFLGAQNLRPSTQKNYWNKFLTFFTYLQKTQGVIIEVGFAATPTVSFDNIVWSDKQIALFLGYEPKNETEKLYFDVFRLQFFTCSRISEILSLKMEDFTIKMSPEGSIFTIKKFTKKDGKLLERPVPKKIWESCRSYIRKTGSIIVNGNNVQYNRMLRKMLSNIEGFDSREVVYYNGENGKPLSKTVSMIDQTASHMLRKAGGAFYENKGLSSDLITKHLTGHTRKVYDNHYRRNLLRVDDMKKVAEMQKIV